MSGLLSDADREALAEVAWPQDVHIVPIVEAIVARHVKAALTEAAEHIEAQASADLPHLADENPVKQQVQYAMRRAARIVRALADSS